MEYQESPRCTQQLWNAYLNTFKYINIQTCTAQSGIWIIEAINEKSTILVQFCSNFQRLTAS